MGYYIVELIEIFMNYQENIKICVCNIYNEFWGNIVLEMNELKLQYTLIQVDISDHPPTPLSQGTILQLVSFSTFFRS